MDIESAKRKVQKLMAVAKSGSGASEGEADNALRQAEFLMRQFSIEAAECIGTAAQSNFDWANSFAPYGIPRQPAKSVPMWYQFIGTSVANFTDTIARMHHKSDEGYGLGFYGERSETLFAVWLLTYLRDTVWRVAAKQKDLPRAAREEFRKAMAMRLCQRMRQLRLERDVELSKPSSGTALIVVSDKLALRDQEFGAPKYSKKKVNLTNAEAAARGRASAENVGFSRVISSNNNGRIAA